MMARPLNSREIDALPNILDVVERISVRENSLILPEVSRVPSSPYFDEGRYNFVSESHDRNIVRLMPTSQSPFTFYRGQSIFHDRCLPSLYRATPSRSEIASNRIKTCEFVRLLCTHPVFNGVRRNLQVDYIALAQHYGLNTEYLDITNSKWVAAFFASTRYDQNTDTYSPVGREFHNGYGVMYISKDIVKCDLRDRFFERNGTIGYQYFERPTKQSSFGYRMEAGEDFNESPYFDKVLFRHDVDASTIVFNMSYRQNRFIPKDTLSKLARQISSSSEVTRAALSMCREWFYPNEPTDFIDDVCAGKKWRIREDNTPIVQFSQEELEEDWRSWNEFGREDLNSRILPIIPIAKIKI